MRRRLVVVLAWMLAGFVLLGCIQHDGPYKGRVVDADTGEPIEGVVVLGVWSRQYFSMAAWDAFYDAHETVTGKDGEFSVPGAGLTAGLMSRVTPMEAIVFKAGHERIYINRGFWGRAVAGLDPDVKNIRWEGERVVISVKKLTMEERKARRLPVLLVPREVREGLQLINAEIDRERREIGRTERY